MFTGFFVRAIIWYMYKQYPNKSYFEQYLTYNEKLGKLFWKKKTKPNNNRVKVGREAGYSNCYGYKNIGLENQEYMYHRVLWVMHHGSIPRDRQIDHIDQNPQNNHISNLRIVTDAENKLNLPMRKTNKSGHRGVHWDKNRKKWFAQIQRNKKTTALGRFDNLEDAVKARKKAEAIS